MTIRKQVEPLGYATQVLELHEAIKAPCRCGKALAWMFSDAEPGIIADAQCACGMRYIAGPLRVEITIEGVDSE